MKKIITVLATFIIFNGFSLGFTISLHTFSGASKPNDDEYIELNMVDTKKTGSEIINIIMVHVNPDNTVSDSVVLFSFPIYEWTNYPYGEVDRRFWFKMPDSYANGKFRITVSYTTGQIGGFYMASVTGIKDETLDTKETPQYYNLDGKLLEEPKGLCIEVIKGVRRKILVY